MKVFIACEFSGRVRSAFAKRGHYAVSCDLLPTEIHGPHIISTGYNHLKDLLYNEVWDCVIGHPPCTRLCNSVWWYIKRHGLYNEVEQAAGFFNMILNSPAKLKCLENPIMNPEARKFIRKYDQIIQPYNFMENASKQTCLWLEGLPALRNTGYFEPQIIKGKRIWGNQTPGGWNKLGPGQNRGHERSRTYVGIAEAMAEQWGCL